MLTSLSAGGSRVSVKVLCEVESTGSRIQQYPKAAPARQEALRRIAGGKYEGGSAIA